LRIGSIKTSPLTVVRWFIHILLNEVQFSRDSNLVWDCKISPRLKNIVPFKRANIRKWPLLLAHHDYHSAFIQQVMVIQNNK